MSLFSKALCCLLDDRRIPARRSPAARANTGRFCGRASAGPLSPTPARPPGAPVWATRLYPFFAWLKENYDSLDIVVRLAQDTGVVLMDGGHGFDAPEWWSVRVSLANLNADDYIAIGQRLSAMLDVRRGVWK